jgi:DNA-binding transcriptional MerR regulator
MRTGELARRAQVNIQTLRFYEREGLIRKPGRTVSGYRAYEAADLDRVVAIKQCQALGFTLQEVREVLDLHEALATSAADAGRLSAVHDKLMERARSRLAIMEDKIRSLTQMKGELDRLVQRLSTEDGAACVPAATDVRRAS